MPVLPLVGSMIVPPGRSRPSRSACSTMAWQMRSFTLPPGFSDSSLAQTSAPRPSSCGRRDSRTTGVEPIRSRALRATWQGSGMNCVVRRAHGEHIRRVQAGSIQRVLAIFPGALGDVLLVLPTLRRLRRRAGGPLTLVLAEPLRALARTIGVADEVASLDDARSAWLYGASVVPPWLRDRPAVYAWLGADGTLRDRLGVVSDAVRLLSVERGPGRLHAAVAYARAAGVGASRRALSADARVEPAGSSLAHDLVARVARPLLVVHRGAGAPAKRWARDAFAAVVSAWRGGVVELLGPAEAHDEPLDGAVAVRDWSLPDVAALLRLADRYVGNDSGVSHLAGAVGTCGAAVFTSTDPVRWRPLGTSIAAIRGGADDGAAGRATARVLQALTAVESLTSCDPGSSVRA